MNEWVEETEAEYLEEARNKLKAKGHVVVREFIFSGELETVVSIGATVEEAVTKAKSSIPAGAKIEAQAVKIAPSRVVLQVAGDNEESAGKGKAEVIESVSLNRKGRKGLLGFFKTPNIYDVQVSQQAVVEIRFREKARLHARVHGYLAEDLILRIQELRGKNAPWSEILQFLNPKEDRDVQTLLIKLREAGPTLVLQTIEEVCRTNEKWDWKLAIDEAYRQAVIARAAIEAERKRQEAIQEAIKEAERQAAIARARELRAQEIKLRALDHKIAEELLLYRCIDWDKTYSRLTGIPWGDWEHHRNPDERDRRTIPRYSSDSEAFLKLQNSRSTLRNLYLQLLEGEGLSEATASLEQKCIALLEAQRRRRREGRTAEFDRDLI